MTAKGYHLGIRGSAVWFIGSLLLFILSWFIAVGTTEVAEQSRQIGSLVERVDELVASETGARQLDMEKEKLSLQLHQSTVTSVGVIAANLVKGLLICSLLCAVVGVVLFIRPYRRQGLALEEMHESLGVVVGQIQHQAGKVLREAQEKKASVDNLERQVAELEALATMNEEQTSAVRRTLSKGARLGISLGILGIVTTVAIGIWTVVATTP